MVAQSNHNDFTAPDPSELRSPFLETDNLYGNVTRYVVHGRIEERITFTRQRTMGPRPNFRVPPRPETPFVPRPQIPRTFATAILPPPPARGEIPMSGWRFNVNSFHYRRYFRTYQSMVESGTLSNLAQSLDRRLRCTLYYLVSVHIDFRRISFIELLNFTRNDCELNITISPENQDEPIKRYHCRFNQTSSTAEEL